MMIEYDARDADLIADFVEKAVPGGNRQLGVAYRIALHCRVTPDADWKTVWHSRTTEFF